MTTAQLETWLKRRPRPAHLRCKTADGETRDVDLGIVRSWAKVAETVLTLDTVTLEALGPDKSLLRATRLDDDDADDADDTEDPDTRAPQIPPSRGVRGSTSDPETARFAIFTAAISEAYRHSTTVAFTKYSELVDSITTRYESQERTLGHLQEVIQGLSEQLADAQAHIAELSQTPPPAASDPTSLEGLASVFAQGAAFGGQTPPPAAPNGAAKPNGVHHQ